MFATNRLIPSLLVYDIAETIRFFELLGFELTACDNGNPPTWAEVSSEGISFQFYSDPPVGTEPSPVCGGTFYIHREDIMALAGSLEGVVEFTWGPGEMDYGMLEFAVRDPNGYLIAFSQDSTSSDFGLDPTIEKV